MGGLLKEALKSVFGVTHWSYAVFWKIGCHNTKLLIWEECYYESALSGLQNPEPPFVEPDRGCGSGNPSQPGSQPWDKVGLLINKMMNNRIVIVGQGLVGRAAFTGNHQWINANNYVIDAQPPQVLNEVHLQFSAGMQTVAVIPVFPHGVLQLGSSTTIMENMGFVNVVKSLILCLGSIPGALLSNSGTNDCVEHTGIPISLENSVSMDSAGIYRSTNSVISVAEGCNQQRNSSQASGATGQSSSLTKQIQENPTLWTNPQVAFCNSQSEFNCLPRIGQSVVSHSGIKSMEQLVVPDAGLQNHVINSDRTDNDSFRAPIVPLLHANGVFPFGEKLPGSIRDCLKHESKSFSSRSLNSTYEDALIEPPSGDDLFDVLGADLKSKLLNAKWNGVVSEESDSKMQNVDKDTSVFRDMQNHFSDTFPVNEGVTDHLLDAVVSSAQSSAKQISDDELSCRTTLSMFGNSSVPSSSTTVGRVNFSNIIHGELLGSLHKPLSKEGTLPPGSFISGCSKDDAGICSQTTSAYGSQISSLVESGHTSKHDSSLSTAYSKRNDEMTKPNRKRLKPGENPRPRPKDRQMIQDRVKELREIVPNGAKCSIDALLEKTIKHMLFLQSVTKHADKLKPTGESKIKENLDGGTTWAFEVGSQSMICPIIVDDLNPPRQMLVEVGSLVLVQDVPFLSPLCDRVCVPWQMLCEERGFFLEIADIIRGMGLSILKGVMETRNDKIWARFAVEANRDVTRVEIFMSLVHRLEQTMKGSASSANTFDTNNVMVKQTFH
ncbi:Transcription factor-related, putative isoform 2 [Hibiscus syriacus]|uniref:Transcription factor-related, putative isoform 2 n=1 Tax=Hibiscus syriacus TaxID=106335 RepID=A0A6A2YTU4_HIBSY|nr:Transcription factor-related, putative isoform 2 [Hibiscus syriacus]